MIDHVSVGVSNLAASATFYDRVLEPLGLKRITERDEAVGYGKRYPEFWLNSRPGMTTVSDDTGNHACLRAPTRDAVRSFYETAIALGGRGDGEPRDRRATVTNYFGAFIRDPDGNMIEAAAFARNSPVGKED